MVKLSTIMTMAAKEHFITALQLHTLQPRRFQIVWFFRIGLKSIPHVNSIDQDEAEFGRTTSLLCQSNFVAENNTNSAALTICFISIFASFRN